jgi:hypothetical protein
VEPVTYTEPSGDEADRPTAEQVVATMRRQYADGWGPYSPVGVLRQGNPPSRVLVLVRHPRHGWYLEYKSDWSGGAYTRHVVADDPAGPRRAWVQHWESGQTWYFSAACFRPQEQAERAVADFLGGRDPSATGRWSAYRWGVHKRAEPPPDGLLQRLLGRPVVESADPPE